LVIVLSDLRLFTASDYSFWNFLAIFLSVLRLFTACDYSFGIFWSLYCPYVVYLRLLITPLVYFGHCIVLTSSIYGFLILHWYILVIVLSVLRLFMASDYSFGIFWSLYCPYVVYLRLLITRLVYLDVVLSVLRLFTASDYFFVIFCPLYCPYFVYLRLLITPLVYFGHCIVRTSSIYGFWLLLWYILGIILSVRRLFTASDYSIGIFWSLYCAYFVYLRLLITSLVYFGHCIVRTSSIYGFWLLLWYILVIVLSVLRLFTASDYFIGIFCPFYWSYIGQFTAYDYSFGIFWLLYCPYFICGMLWSLYCSYFIYGIFWSLFFPYFVYLRLMITPLVYFSHCIVRTSSIYDLWLLLWYILVFVLSVRRLFTTYDYFFGIFWSLYCPYSSIYGFWLLLWYILYIVLSVRRLFTASDYCFGIFWSLYCPYFVYLRFW
jgi:hypothetical protein